MGILAFFVISTAVPRAYGQDTGPTAPIVIEKWSIHWDRLAGKAVIDATFKNSSKKRLSDLVVVLEFIDERGITVRKSLPWRKSYLSGSSRARMKLNVAGCPSFKQYYVKLSGTAEEPFEQVFEGRYWPEKLGATPQPPEPVVIVKGTASVRLIGSSEELVRIRKREGLVISGTVKNMGDKPAEKVVVVIQLLRKERVLKEEECKIKGAKLYPGKSASFRTVIKRPPNYTRVRYIVKFKGPEPEGYEDLEAESFDIDAGPILLEDCRIDPKSGLFTGTLVNQSGKTLRDIIVTISITKGGATTSYDVAPGGEIKPNDRISLIKATTPGYDTFSIDVAFSE